MYLCTIQTCIVHQQKLQSVSVFGCFSFELGIRPKAHTHKTTSEQATHCIANDAVFSSVFQKI